MPIISKPVWIISIVAIICKFQIAAVQDSEAYKIGLNRNGKMNESKHSLIQFIESLDKFKF